MKKQIKSLLCGLCAAALALAAPAAAAVPGQKCPPK